MELLLLLSMLGAGSMGLMALFGEDDDPATSPARSGASGGRPASGGGDDTGTPDPTPDDPTAATFLRGTDGPDTLRLTGRQVGHALAGPDRIEASGDATAYGDTGPDQITLSGRATGYGGYGGDLIEAGDASTGHGGAGDDRISATGSAVIHGDAGADILVTRGNATAYGGDDDDSLLHSDDGDARATARLYGGAGNDLIRGLASAADDVEFHGNDGNDTLILRTGIEGFGGTGDDTLFSEGGGILTSGPGADLFLVNALDKAEGAAGADGADTVTITDFRKSLDRIQIDLNGPPSALTLSDDGTDTTLTIAWEPTPGTGFETGPVNSSIIVRGVTGLTLDDFTFSRGTAYAQLGGFQPLPGDGLHGQVTAGTAAADSLALSGDQPLAMTGAGNDTVTGGSFSRLGLVTLGAGDDSFIDGEGRAIVHGGAGNDSYSSNGALAAAALDSPAQDIFYGGDGNDTATILAQGPGTPPDLAFARSRLVMGAGNDVVTISRDYAYGAFIDDGSGDDRISAWMGSSVASGDGADTITFGIAEDHVITGREPASLRNLSATDRIILDIDRDLPGPLSARFVPADTANDIPAFTELRIGTSPVAILWGQNIGLDDPRLTINRGVTFT